MMFGHIETMAERLEHLRRVRDLQDRTGVLPPLSPGRSSRTTPPFRQVKRLKKNGLRLPENAALSRIFLDNIDNIQASWVTQGPKIAQLSLFSAPMISAAP
jgi:cyclic dehypoxanthinyl futalosine synthase